MPVRNWGSETLVNTATTGDQRNATVGALDDGGYVVAWQDTSVNANGVIFYQRYDAFGHPVGAQGSFSTATISVGGTTSIGANHPSVVGLPFVGGFAIGYTEVFSAGNTDPSIRYFDRDGNPTGIVAPAFLPVGYLNMSDSAAVANQVSLAAQADGSVFAVYHDQSATSGDVFAQLLNDTNTTAQNRFLINGTTSGDQSNADVAQLAAGGVAFVWMSGTNVFARSFFPDGTNAMPEALVTSAAIVQSPHITALANGGFVVTYTVDGDILNEPFQGVRARMYNVVNQPVGGEIVLNTHVQGTQAYSDIAATADGGFVAVWFDGNGDMTIRGQVYNSLGQRNGSEFVVSTGHFQTNGDSNSPVMANLNVAALEDGRLVVSWEGKYLAGPDTSGYSVHTQIIDPRDGIVNGNDDANTLIGSEQVNDQINAQDGNDVLLGLGGDDFLIGGDGDDQLYGSAGADNLAGGAGTDMARYDNATTAMTVDLLHPANNTGEAAGDTFDSIEGVFGGGFGDHLYGNNSGSILYGQGGNDTIYGGNGVDNIHGGAGTDVISGGAGNDSVFGDADNDVIFGYTGIDFLYGGAGADSLNGEADFDYAGYSDAGAGVTADLQFASSNTGDAAGDTYSGIEGLLGSGFADSLRTDGGSNWIFGAGGDDMIFARGGNDYISGDGGNDTMYGEAGNDTFIHRTGEGQDTVGDFTAGAGIGDVLNILEGASFDSYAEVFAAAAQVGLNTVITFAAGDTITLLNVTKTNLVTDDFSFV